MRLRLRLLWLLLTAPWRSRMHALDEAVLRLRIHLNDIDVRVMTNDRILAFMDLGRVDLIIRTGLLRPMMRNGWTPVVLFAAVRFRQPLRLFRAYEMRTRILYWDERAFYIEQRFEREGRVVATGYVCATLRSGEGVVPAATIIAATGQHVTKPEKPEIVSLLQAGEAGVQQLQQADAQRAPTR